MLTLLNQKHSLSKNFRPVSNLPFISKILEKVVLTQLQKHLSENDLLQNQTDSPAAYQRHYTTGTANSLKA